MIPYTIEELSTMADRFKRVSLSLVDSMEKLASAVQTLALMDQHISGQLKHLEDLVEEIHEFGEQKD